MLLLSTSTHHESHEAVKCGVFVRRVRRADAARYAMAAHRAVPACHFGLRRQAWRMARVIVTLALSLA